MNPIRKATPAEHNKTGQVRLKSDIHSYRKPKSITDVTFDI